MDRDTSNIGMDDYNFLQNLNNEKVIENIGAIVFISLMLIVGIPDNAVALYVYFRKYKPSTYRTFILCLSFVDFVTCGMSMPFTLVVLRYPIAFPNGDICRIFQFVTYTFCLWSIFILVTIAVERYRKICVPHGRQLSEKMSKYICMLDLIVACCFSWPVIIIFGNKSYRTGSNRINGTECTFSDNFVHTNYPIYFNCVLLFVFFASFISLTIIYILIGKQIFRMKSRIYKMNRQPKSMPDETLTTQTTEQFCSKTFKKAEAIRTTKGEDTKEERRSMSFTLCKDNICEGVDSNINTTSRSHKRSTDKGNGEKQSHKTINITRMSFIIAVVLVCSFLPHLALRIAAFASKNFVQNLSFSGIAAYQTFRYTFFVNSMANPIIYGFYDRKFLSEVFKIYRSFTNNCLRRK